MEAMLLYEREHANNVDESSCRILGGFPDASRVCSPLIVSYIVEWSSNMFELLTCVMISARRRSTCVARRPL